jgi:hypothetical protein
MCLGPNTLVLRSDFTWSKIKDIHVGDELVATDEYSPGKRRGRRLRRSIVQGKRTLSEKAYRITFDNGKSIVCTGKHRWLSRKIGTDYKWRSIEADNKKKLRVGDKVRRVVVDTWDDGDFEDGWIGGMLDGEGSLATRRLGGNIGISQVDGGVFDRVERYFRSREYNYRIEIDKAERKSKFGSKPVNKIVLSRIDEIMKLIGVTRPSRFLNRNWWEGKELPQLKKGPCSTITQIEYLGEQEVVDLQTSTKTFIAEGYVSHNSTFIALLFLDTCLFTPNVSAGIICHTRNDAEELFKTKIKYPYEHLDHDFKEFRSATVDSARQLTFSNGSSIRVGTSMRSGTCQLLHISEFGKICAKYPEKAVEIVTGSLNTVETGNFIFIESTAEGRGGYFFDYAMEAYKNMKGDNPLTPLDFKLHFFPWQEQPGYELDFPEYEFDAEIAEYFRKLEMTSNIILPHPKKVWYAKKREQQGEFIYREYPTTFEEAFLVSNEGFFYSTQFRKLYERNQITHVPHANTELVYTFWDLGLNDKTCIWFIQYVNREYHIIDYYENSDEPLTHYVSILQHKKDDLGYIYGEHWFPHDIQVRELTTGKARIDTLRSLGLNVLVAPKMPVEDGIDAVRNILQYCWFDAKKCISGIRGLENYRRTWNDKLQCYSSRPLHDSASDPADAFRTFAICENNIGFGGGMSENEADDLWDRYVAGV